MQITTLQLWSADVPALAAFYERVLPGAAEVSTDDTLRLRVGAALLVFKQAAAGWEGRYHYALRVGPERFAAAKAHVAATASLARDTAGSDEFAFDNWGARAFYWYDAAGNIAEIIAHRQAEEAGTPFGWEALGGIAEIGIASGDPIALGEQLRRELGINDYGDASEEFAPVGDDDARLILVRTGRIWMPESGIAALPTPATIQLRRDDGAAFRLRCTASGVVVSPA